MQVLSANETEALLVQYSHGKWYCTTSFIWTLQNVSRICRTYLQSDIITAMKHIVSWSSYVGSVIMLSYLKISKEKQL